MARHQQTQNERFMMEITAEITEIRIPVIHQMRLFESRLIKKPMENIENALPKAARITPLQAERKRIFEAEARLYPEARINDHSLRRLAAAIVIKAIEDAKGDDPDLRREAFYWLQSEAARLFYDALGLNDDCIEKWIENGMPYRKKLVGKK